MAGSGPQARAIRRGSEGDNTLQPNTGVCFVYAKLLDDGAENVLSDSAYELRSVDGETALSGATDSEGVLRHDYLPDEYFEIECRGATETVEVYYMSEMDRYEDRPWYLRMKDVGASASSG